MKLIMCRGLPASGKSTWANHQLIRDSNIVIVDSDEIRKKQFSGYDERYELLVQVEKQAQIHRALRAGKTVISTDPNLLSSNESSLRAIANKHKAEFEIKFFDTSVEECIDRDSKREKKVGADNIRRWAKRAGIQSKRVET